MTHISIIVPAYRARNFISQALESVRQQTHRDWELIIVDDASPEPADDLVINFAKCVPPGSVRLLKHESNRGLGGARNTGIMAAAGSHLAFLDHDDIWLPDHLESVLTELQTQDADLAFSGVEMFDSASGETLGNWEPTPAEWSDLRRSLFNRCFLAPSAVVLRKEAILKAGLFDTSANVHYVEDFDLWLRMLHMGFKFAYLPKVTCRYRKHPESATQRRGLMDMGLADVQYRHMREIDLPYISKRRIVVGAYLRAASVLWECQKRREATRAYLKGTAIRLYLKR